jgi:hypothetical protein
MPVSQAEFGSAETCVHARACLLGDGAVTGANSSECGSTSPAKLKPSAEAPAWQPEQHKPGSRDQHQHVQGNDG